MRKGRKVPRVSKARDSLRAKYRQICAKYEALVRRVDGTSAEQIGVFQLGWWALRTSSSALALVRNGGISLFNNRWAELDRGTEKGRGWELLSTGTSEATPVAHQNLRDLALYETARLLDDRGQLWHVSRYRRAHDVQVVEVRTETLRSMHTAAVLIHDVTEEVQAENELRGTREALHERHRMQSIGEVASGVAHDLNNALNVMRLRLALMQAQAIDDEQKTQIASLTRIIDDAATRVARMQDLSRKQSEEPLDVIDLREIIDESVELASTQLEQLSLHGKRFHVVTNVPAHLQVRANAAELKHLFVNLLLNARDAMPGGGTISIEGHCEEGAAIVAVADEGTGIPEENLERIFESFFTTKGKDGTGLGLSMARGAMSRIGGTISARNRAPRGAEFVLRFPRLIGGNGLAVAVSTRTQPAPQPWLRVLLVDDDADCLAVTEEVLQHEGLSVTVARSGDEALARLMQQRYDVLLCDIGMPEMSGWEVAHEARMRQPGLAIYMVTGWASEFAADDARRRSVDGIFAKPLDLEQLRRVLARVVAAPDAAAAPDS
jgi:signal transduction histidine kinase/ActR/RegA family two-component response regulator